MPSDKNLSPLHVAVYNNSRNDVQRLLDQGADTEVRTEFGNTPLHFTQIGPLQPATSVVYQLLEAGAYVQALNNEGLTPLLLAARRNIASPVRALLSGGANPNAIDKDSRTPLHILAKHTPCTSKSIELLLDAGADVKAKDKDGKTAFDLFLINEVSKNAPYLTQNLLSTDYIKRLSGAY